MRIHTYPELSRRQILGVDYQYFSLPNDDEMYVTDLGAPFLESLLPQNHWGDPAWFQARCQKLSGTSCIYRIETKPVADRSIDLVFKWNRMGQDIPVSNYCAGIEYHQDCPFRAIPCFR
jgi:hypothetical protein